MTDQRILVFDGPRPPYYQTVSHVKCRLGRTGNGH